MPDVLTSWDEKPEAPAGGAFDASFNTKLKPSEENAYKAWKAKYAPKDSGEDYDLRGAFKAGLTPDPATGHWPDTFKKPNHPTFSDQSIYAPFGKPGTWKGEQYVPAPSGDQVGTKKGQDAPSVVQSWDELSTAPSFMQRAAVAAEPVVTPALKLAQGGLGYPALEAAAHLGTGMLAFPLSGILGAETEVMNMFDIARRGQTTRESGAETVRRAQEMFTYKPQTKAGQEFTETALKPLELLGDLFNWSGEAVSDVTGSPALGAMVNAVGQAFVGPKAIHGAANVAALGASSIAASMARARQAKQGAAPAAEAGEKSVAEQMKAVRPAPAEEHPVTPPPAGAAPPAAAPSSPEVVTEWGPVKIDVEPPRAWVSPAPGQPPAVPAIPAPKGAPLFTPKPGDDPEAPRHGVADIPSVMLPVERLKLSAEVPQFKKAADVRGVVEPLGGKWDPIGVGPIQVWERLNGDLEVISGRHRLDKVQREGVPLILGQVHREADGFTKQHAATLDAELNIRDGQGSVADYATYFRQAGIDQGTADARGLLARAKGKTGFSIAHDASEEVFAAHSAGILSDEAAASIARAAPGNSSLQAVGLKLLQEGKSITLAENTMRALSLMPRGEQRPEQGDIFGFDDSLIREQLEVAKRAAAAQREIREQIAAVSGATKRPEIARKLGVDVKDPQAVQAKIEELRGESQRLENWPLYPDLVERFGGRRAEPYEPEAQIEEGAPAVDDQTGAMFQARGRYGPVQASMDQKRIQNPRLRALAAMLDDIGERQQPLIAQILKGMGKPEAEEARLALERLNEEREPIAREFDAMMSMRGETWRTRPPGTEQARARYDPNQSGVIEGEDITVSDTGMAEYYDRIVPKIGSEISRKLGGGKVSEVPIDIQGRPERAEGLAEQREYVGPELTQEVALRVVQGERTSVEIANQVRDIWREVSRGMSTADAVRRHGSIAAAEAIGGEYRPLPSVLSKQMAIEITPAMREKIMGGQALFQPKPEYGAGQERVTPRAGAPDEVRQAKGRPQASRPAAAAGQLDLFTQAPVSGSPAKTLEKIVVGAEKVGEKTLRVDRIRTAEDAATAFQDLSRSPVEKFQVIGLDANDRPIAYFDMFAGTVTQTSVYPREVWTAIYQTPGVKSVWISHQHPSGLAEPSHADMILTRALQKALTPDIGVTLKGHVIITKDDAIDIGPDGNDLNPVQFRAGGTPHTVPIMERVIQQDTSTREVLQSPQAMRDFFRTFDPKESGILVLTAQHAPVAWWPMSIAEMAKLKTGNIDTGMAALMRKVGRSNAAAAVAYTPDVGTPAFDAAVRNIGTALELADVKMLDSFAGEPGGAPGQPRRMVSAAEMGRSVAGLTDFNIGLTPKAMAEGVGAVADLAKGALARAKETKLGAAASEWGDAVITDIQTKVVPMAAGTDAARAITKDFANADRLSRYQWARFDDILKKNFTQEQRVKMWDAAEDENLIRTENLPPEERVGRGLDRLTKEERATMDTLHEYGEQLLQRAKDVGLFRGEGVEYWSPRIVAMIGEDGTISTPKGKAEGPPSGPGRSPYTSPTGANITTQAGSLKHRKYLTAVETEAAAKTKFGAGAQVVRDIRTMPMAMARIERAIAGKELINAIKEFGKGSGQDLVVDAAKDGYFTIDHPAFKIYRYRPDVKFTEAWDKNMWDQMTAFADDLGVDAKRVLSMRGQKWGYATRGGEVRTRFGGPETVMTHELGHQLDFKYGLVQRFFGGDRPKSDFILKRQIAKAEREGNAALAEKLDRQMRINGEMRDLADLRFEGADASNYFKKYVRVGTEKIANMVHAYVHAPEKFRSVAPTAYDEFKRFLNEHPELSRLDQIKPSLTLTSGGFKKRPPGEDFDVFPVYVSREFEGPLKAVMSDTPGKLYQAMMDLKGKTMSVIMYSPMIHNGVEWGRALPLMPGKIITFKAYFDGNVAKNNPEIMSQAIREGLVPIGHRFYMQDITGLLEDPSLTPGRSWTAKLAGAAVGLVSKKGAEAVKRGIDTAGDFWHNTLLWDRIADLQMGIYANMKADLIKGGMEPETAGRLAAHFGNRYAGALPNEAMSGLARKAANFAFFSRTFTLGNLGVMKDMITGLPRDVQAQILRDAGEVAAFSAKGEAQKIAIKAFATDIALMYAANSALQSGFDAMKRDKSGGMAPAITVGATLGAGIGSGLGGKYGAAAGAAIGAGAAYALGPREIGQIEDEYIDRWNRMIARTQESPSDLLKPFAMLESLTPTSENEPGKEYRVLYDYDEKGTGIYVRLPTGKIGEEFLSWATSPLDILKRKEGTIARPLIQMVTNDKGFGRRVYDPDAKGFTGAAKAMGNIAWNFLSQQFPVDSLNAAIDMAKGQQDETDALKVVGPAVGLTFSKGAPGGPEVGQLFSAERAHRAEVNDAMPEIKKLIKYDKMDEAVARMHEAHMTPEEIRQTIRFATMPRSRLTPRAMLKFFQTAPQEEREKMERRREGAP